MFKYQVKFLGNTGSIPTPLSSDQIQRKLFEVLLLSLDQNLKNREDVNNFLEGLPFYLRGSYHGNTPCIQIINPQHEDHLIILDAGTGIKDIAHELVGKLQPHNHIHLFITHLHWDHIQGFPFFTPIYQKSTRITIHGCHPHLQDSFRLQQNDQNFPVALDKLPAEIDFHIMEPDTDYSIGAYTIRAFPVPHPGGCYSYRITREGKTVVYATDLEIKDFSDKTMQPYFDFFYQAEYLIYDSMYTLPENIIKEDWGHSSCIIGVDIATKSQVKQLVIFHHEPAYSDEKIYELYKNAHLYKKLRPNSQDIDIIIGYDGLVLDIN
jgi:phosphoribosyl 1,2-cyclic phosphodiesterase